MIVGEVGAEDALIRKEEMAVVMWSSRTQARA
jgi:hypothetical protein